MKQLDRRFTKRAKRFLTSRFRVEEPVAYWSLKRASMNAQTPLETVAQNVLSDPERWFRAYRIPELIAFYASKGDASDVV